MCLCLCIWGVGEVTTGSSPPPWSTAHTSQCGRTFHKELLIPGRFREDCEDASNAKEDTQGQSGPGGSWGPA